MLKKQPIKHNVNDRDKVLVPPNWDSWGKIRVLSDGFDVETINKGWSQDIEESYQSRQTTNDTDEHEEESPAPKVAGGSVEVYEEKIRDPQLDSIQGSAADTNGLKLEVSSLDTQSFLATQLVLLEKTAGMDSSRQIRGRNISFSHEGDDDHLLIGEGRVNEHIGPVQFNMGGIQVDADDMLQRLKVCGSHAPLRTNI